MKVRKGELCDPGTMQTFSSVFFFMPRNRTFYAFPIVKIYQKEEHLGRLGVGGLTPITQVFPCIVLSPGCFHRAQKDQAGKGVMRTEYRFRFNLRPSLRGRGAGQARDRQPPAGLAMRRWGFTGRTSCVSQGHGLKYGLSSPRLRLGIF